MKPIVLTVQQLTSLIKEQIEGPFQKVSVQGEIANAKQAASGHLYFSLIDKECLLNAVLFRGQAAHLSFMPKNGDSVIAEGDIVLFQARGSYQLIVKSLQLSGLGAQLLAKQKLKQKLHALGWFAQERKRPLPESIKTIGIITSPTGAVIRDIITILRRRCSSFHLVINPVVVQGEGAPQQIAKAIHDMNAHHQGDVLIICRGGGSSEDLAAFDTEEVAQSCFSSRIPIISAVGHETDTTILDLVADLRAPTPSAAAEMASKEKKDLSEKMAFATKTLIRTIRGKLLSAQTHLNSLIKHLNAHHPSKKLAEKKVEISHLQESIQSSFRHTLHNRRKSLLLMKTALRSLAPFERLSERRKHLISSYLSIVQTVKKRITSSKDSLRVARQTALQKIEWQLLLKRKLFQTLLEKNSPTISMRKKKEFLRTQLTQLSSHILSLNPYLPLKKGYALIKGENEKVCTSINSLDIGEKVELIFSDGTAHARIEDTSKKGFNNDK